MKAQSVQSALLVSGVVALSVGSGLGLWPGPEWAVAAEEPVWLLRSRGDNGADTPSGRLVLRVPAVKAEGAVTPVEPPALVEEAIDPPVEPTEPEPGGAFLEEDDGIPKRVLIGIDQGGLMRARTDISVEDAGGNIIPRPSRWNIALLEVAKIVNELDDEDEFAVYRFFGGY